MRTQLPPGPGLPRYAQAALWTWRYPEFTRDAHRRFGPSFSVRLGGLVPAVVTSDRDVIRRLYTGDPLTKRHGNDMMRGFTGEDSHSLLLMEPADHLVRRRELLPVFHGRRIREHEELMVRLMDAEIDAWPVDEEFAVMPRTLKVTLELILRVVLGVTDRRLRDEMFEFYDGMVNVPGSAFVMYLPGLSTRSRWNPLSQMVLRQMDRIAGLVSDQIRRTRQDPELSDRRDMLAELIKTSDASEDGGMTDDDLRDEMLFLVAAGHETTAGTLAWALEHLAHRHDVVERARAADAAGDTAYLEALVKEVLRIVPPIPHSSARHVLEPFEVAGVEIDPSVTITVDAWGIHHDPDLYPEPAVLRPERFLDEKSGESHLFLTFGGGARRCIGASMALLEARLMLATILRRFDVHPVREVAAPVRRGVTLTPRGGGRVRLSAV